MALLSMSANCFQLLRAALTRFPLGHHCTLPRPMMSVPSSASPLRISIVIEFSLLSLVNSTEFGRWATTLVKTGPRLFRLRRVGMLQSYPRCWRESCLRGGPFARSSIGCAASAKCGQSRLHRMRVPDVANRCQDGESGVFHRECLQVKLRQFRLNLSGSSADLANPQDFHRH